jgi:hypothetical protein
MAVIFAVVIVLLVRLNGELFGVAPSPSAIQTQAATSSPSAAPPSFGPTPPTGTGAPSPLPQATLAGDVPGPDATVPPNTPVLPGLELASLVDAWQALDLTCVSKPGIVANSGAGFNVHCEGTDPAANADIVADSGYWTPGGIQMVSAAVTTITANQIDGPAVADRWLVPFAQLLGGDPAAAWVRDHVGDEACGQGCTEVVGGIRYSYYYGRLGSQELFIGQ